MVRPARSEDGHQRPDPDPFNDRDHRAFASAVWSVPSYLLSGMAVYGGLGWLLDRWLGLSVFFPIGILVGLGLAIYLVYLRIGR